jgi:hypothetical protein
MPALTLRAELDQLPCSDCGGMNALYLCCNQHPTALTLPFYTEGELRLECAECGEIYITVRVA